MTTRTRTKNVIEVAESFVIEHCCNCGMAFAMTHDFYNRRQEDGATFYCPNGHGQIYTRRKKLEEQLEKLKSELHEAKVDVAYWNREAEEQALAAIDAKRKAAAAKGQLTKVKKRIGNGVCPCCNRQFMNLTRHMATQHPGYKDEAPEPA